MTSRRPDLTREPSLTRALGLDSVFGATLGGLLVAGGYGRLGSASFDFVREAGGPYIWGTLFVAQAVLLALAAIFGSRAQLVVALYASALMHALFGGAFLVAVVTNNATPLIGPLLFWWLSLRAINQAQAFRRAQS